MTTVDPTEPRTYGGWRRPKGFGLGKLGTLGTALLFTDLLFALVVLLATGLVIPTLIVGLGGLVGVAVVALPDTAGQTAGQKAATRAGYARSRVAGSATYRSGPLAAKVGTFRLPGLLAQSTLLEGRDAQGHAFALVHVPRRGTTRSCSARIRTARASSTARRSTRGSRTTGSGSPRSGANRSSSRRA